MLERQIKELRPRVLGEIKRCGFGMDDAEDICSKTVISLLKNAEKIDSGKPLLNYWLRTTQRAMIDVRKRRNDHCALVIEDECETLEDFKQFSDPHSGDIEFRDEELEMSIYAAMLPVELQSIYDAVFIQGQSMRTVAELLNVSQDFVAYRVRRIRRILQSGFPELSE